jgi:hypothetical protein
MRRQAPEQRKLDSTQTVIAQRKGHAQRNSEKKGRNEEIVRGADSDSSSSRCRGDFVLSRSAVPIAHYPVSVRSAFRQGRCWVTGCAARVTRALRIACETRKRQRFPRVAPSSFQATSASFLTTVSSRRRPTPARDCRGRESRHRFSLPPHTSRNERAYENDDPMVRECPGVSRDNATIEDGTSLGARKVSSRGNANPTVSSQIGKSQW